jgi:hypothetical protein
VRRRQRRPRRRCACSVGVRLRHRAVTGGSVRQGRCLCVLGRESCRRAFCAPLRGRGADGDVLDAVDVRVADMVGKRRSWMCMRRSRRGRARRERCCTPLCRLRSVLSTLVSRACALYKPFISCHLKRLSFFLFCSTSSSASLSLSSSLTSRSPRCTYHSPPDIDLGRFAMLFSYLPTHHLEDIQDGAHTYD